MIYRRFQRTLSLVALVFAAGCTFDSAGLFGDPWPPNDAALDTAISDGSTPTEGPALDSVDEKIALDSLVDGADFLTYDGEDPDLSSDTVPEDLALDVLAPDVLAPDTLAPDSSPPVACDIKYASVPSYRWCSDTPSSCTFFFDHPTSASCDQMCALGGGTCILAQQDIDNSCSGYDDTCDGVRGDSLCTCTR